MVAEATNGTVVGSSLGTSRAVAWVGSGASKTAIHLDTTGRPAVPVDVADNGTVLASYSGGTELLSGYTASKAATVASIAATGPVALDHTGGTAIGDGTGGGSTSVRSWR